MLDCVVREGDEVTITIPKENRDWGYNPYPDGTRAIVLGFSEISRGRIGSHGKRPGVYHNRACCRIQLEDGAEHTEYTDRLDLVDSDEYERRVAEWQDAGRLIGYDQNQDFIRDLPDTPFWEGDLVRFVEQSHMHMSVVTITSTGEHVNHDVFTIVGIQYEWLEDTRDDGSPWPAYSISDKFGSGWHTSASAHELELVNRGPVWKHFHDEAIDFTDLAEESSFYCLLGHYDEVRNPANDLFSWTLEDLLEAIKAGLVHGIIYSQSLLSSQPGARAIRYHDEELGHRVAVATLQGFHRS